MQRVLKKSRKDLENFKPNQEKVAENPIPAQGRKEETGRKSEITWKTAHTYEIVSVSVCMCMFWAKKRKQLVITPLEGRRKVANPIWRRGKVVEKSCSVSVSLCVCEWKASSCQKEKQKQIVFIVHFSPLPVKFQLRTQHQKLPEKAKKSKEKKRAIASDRVIVWNN